MKNQWKEWELEDIDILKKMTEDGEKDSFIAFVLERSRIAIATKRRDLKLIKNKRLGLSLKKEILECKKEDIDSFAEARGLCPRWIYETRNRIRKENNLVEKRIFTKQETKDEIKRLRTEGMSAEEICEKLKVSKWAVYHYSKK